TGVQTCPLPILAAGMVDYTDYLTEVLDDATLANGPTVSDPALAATTGTDGEIWVTGELAAAQTVTVTYTVTVKADGERGDNVLDNMLAETGNPAPECGDVGVFCTENPIPEIADSKTVNPVSGTPVVAGQELTYTLTFTNDGEAAGNVDKVDDLTHVIDDADVISEPVASDAALAVSREGTRIAITGSLEPGQTVTVSYTVKVKQSGARGDDVL